MTPTLRRAGPVILVALSVAAATHAAEPAASWTNDTGAAMEVAVPSPPEDALFVQLGREGRPYRILLPRTVGSGYALRIPPGATVQAWNREEFARQKDNPFATAARWSAFPRIVVGPLTYRPGGAPGSLVETPAWSEETGRFRAYPEGDFPVTVHVYNNGGGAWNRPRVRLFAPEGWTVKPEVADVISPARKEAREDAPSITQGRTGVLPPTQRGTATFTVRAPKRAVIGSTAPLVAFLRFDAGRRTLTLQNSVDVTIREPVERRYAMNPAGDRFIVHLINRFDPHPLGVPQVDVRAPQGADWTITPPAPVELVTSADAVARVDPPASATDGLTQVAVPVVVTLNGLRMGYTPTVRVAAGYGDVHAGGYRENGVTLQRNTAIAITDAGAGAAQGAAETRLAFDVTSRFAVSDPQQYVSPTWVTITYENRDATRLRLEYDSFSGAGASVASDGPIVPRAGAATGVFLLPDARFGNELDGKADLILTANGGGFRLTSITVSKWDPGAERQ